MKSIKYIFFIVICFTTVLNLKISNKSAQLVVTSINPECVKSPGEFINVAPEATKIITPKYASMIIVF